MFKSFNGGLMNRIILTYIVLFIIIINTLLIVKLDFNHLSVLKWSFIIITNLINFIHLIGCLYFNNRFLIQTTHLIYFTNFTFWAALLIIFI